MRSKNLKIVILFVCLVQVSVAQRGGIKWTANGNAYTKIKDGGIVKVDPKTDAEVVIVRKEQLTLPGATAAMVPQSYTFNGNNTKLLFFTNTAKVWRYNTRGDYWVLDIISNKLKQMGKSLPAQSLMFAKFSPDSRKCAYVSEHNLYVEDIGTGAITKLTRDGSRKLINGTFDWVYEEEFGCRDGFRWSPDGSKIAFWQVDANKIRDYYMLNTTDSIYSKVIPVEYPKVGEAPSPVKIGVVNVENGKTVWMKIPGDPANNYLPRMEWAANNTELVVQQLNRKQNESKLYFCNAVTGVAKEFYAESDKAFIDIKSRWNDDDPRGWDFINNGTAFLWVSEKDGWRHIYKIGREVRKPC